MGKPAEQRILDLEDLVATPGTTGVKAPQPGPKAARQRGEAFVQITATQADRLAGKSSAVTVFLYLMFKSFRVYHKPFALPSDALEHAGVSRFAQFRALRNLVKRGLISVERDGPRKPPVITLIGVTKQG